MVALARFLGGASVALGVLALALSLLGWMMGMTRGAPILGFVSGVSLLVGGSLTYCIGVLVDHAEQIVEHLRVIRRQTEKS